MVEMYKTQNEYIVIGKASKIVKPWKVTVQYNTGKVKTFSFLTKEEAKRFAKNKFKNLKKQNKLIKEHAYWLG